MYLWGLEQVLGRRAVSFSMTPFRDLAQSDAEDDFDQYMAFVDDNGCRYVIDYRDKSDIRKEALEWCDVYGKINYRQSVVDLLEETQRRKVHPVGPNFGINQWSFLSLYSTFLLNRLKVGWAPNWPVGWRAFLAGYNWTRNRRSIREYLPAQGDPGYVFHASRFYRDHSHGEQTNDARARFVRAARACPGVVVEGGLVVRHGNASGYEDVSLQEGFATSAYLEKTARSAIVFNTPAAWGCHGWKLGEYMALGKAIVSMPFVNDLPPGIEHAKNIHIVNGPDELDEAVRLVLQDHSYRRALEENARCYFDACLAPERVVRRILSLGQNSSALSGKSCAGGS